MYSVKLRANPVAFWVGAMVGAPVIFMTEFHAVMTVVVVAMLAIWFIRTLMPSARGRRAPVALAFVSGVAFGYVAAFVAFFLYANWACNNHNECL